MGLLSSIAKAAREIGARVITDGLNVLGTSSNPFYVSIGGVASATAQTTGATPSNVVLDTPAKSTARAVKVLVSACKSDGSKAAGWLVTAMFRCDSSGTITLDGSSTAQTLVAEQDSSFAPSVDLNISGGTIVAVLTGISSTTINWSLKYEVA